MSDILLVVLAATAGFVTALFSGGWLELALWYLRRKHNALWVTLRYQQPMGLTFWAVAIQPLNGQERLISSSSVRALAVIRALSRPTPPTETRDD